MNKLALALYGVVAVSGMTLIHIYAPPPAPPKPVTFAYALYAVSPYDGSLVRHVNESGLTAQDCASILRGDRQEYLALATCEAESR
jgi:hypothetical protein